MTKYMVSSVSQDQLREAGLTNIPSLLYPAYLVENKVIINCTDYANSVLQWIRDGAIYIESDLSKLPPALHYATTEELLENKDEIPFNQLTVEEQLTMVDADKSGDYTKWFKSITSKGVFNPNCVYRLTKK